MLPRRTPARTNLEAQIERRMGCMTGIIQLFDPHQILAGNRSQISKRLPSLPEKSKSEISAVSPENELPANIPARGITLPLPVFEMKDVPKPRLSLDSRANAARQIQRRSVSVVARLMGLDDLPVDEPLKSPELRRSASESRVESERFGFYDCAGEGDAKAEGFRQPNGLFQRKSFDAQEFFPEKKRVAKGVEENGRDLEALKQILEALQLKGLLHSKPPEKGEIEGFKRFSGGRVLPVQAPIVVMKPAQKAAKGRPSERKACDSPHRRRLPEDEGQRGYLAQRRIPAAGRSPKLSPKKPGSGQAGPPKNRRPTQIIPKEVYSTAEEFDSARNEDCMSGRRLLERCDKLLNSIAAFTSSAEQVIPTERQLSPVSVLDSSFLSDESNRPQGFNDQLIDWQEDHWKSQPALTTNNPTVSHDHQTPLHNHQNDEYTLVVDVLHESDRHCSGAEAFASIENRHRTAGSSTLHRRLIFDTVTELADRKREFSPWDSFSGAFAADSTSLIRAVWDELCQIQERVPAADVMEATCGVIRKDMVASSERERRWGVSGEDMSEVALHIERQLFKDLVADTIRELADLAGRCRRTVAFSRRKLVF